VVGADLRAIEPPLDLANVFTICVDLSKPTAAQAILDLAGGPAAVLLCDAAPRLSGVRASDRAREEALLESVEALVPSLLARGGDLLLKLLESPEAQAVARRIGQRFERAKTTRPAATRKGSSESYLLAREHRPAADR
jgi:23S rRNA (uridine2552-2'-O)-methyltransferase